MKQTPTTGSQRMDLNLIDVAAVIVADVGGRKAGTSDVSLHRWLSFLLSFSPVRLHIAYCLI